MIVKVHRSQGRIVLAVCDKDLLGKKFEENDLQIDLTADFYKGSSESLEKMKQLIKTASIMNFVGKKSVDFALENNVIEKQHIGKIKGIPHAQCVRM